MNMSSILIAVLAFLVALVVLSYIVEALRSAPKRPETLIWAPKIPIEYVDLGGIRVRCIRTGVGPNLVLLHTLRTQLDSVHAFDYPALGWWPRTRWSQLRASNCRGNQRGERRHSFFLDSCG